MRGAIDSGANFWNGADFYGPSSANSLHLLHAYFSQYPEDADKVVLSVKSGLDVASHSPVGDRESLTMRIEDAMRILDGKKKIDIFECGRVDPKVPIEETVAVLADFVKEGKIGSIGLSEVGANTIRRAVKIHPIAAVEVEFSLFTTDILTNDVAATCTELDIPIVSYSPLGRGFLTGQIKSFADVTPLQKMGPRFQEENFYKNLELVETINKVSEKKGCTTAQLAIGWARSFSGTKGNLTIVPLPGATTVGRVVENMKVVSLTAEELEEIDRILAVWLSVKHNLLRSLDPQCRRQQRIHELKMELSVLECCQ
jgi:pyridoxine 4-dehydrogenase